MLPPAWAYTMPGIATARAATKLAVRKRARIHPPVRSRRQKGLPLRISQSVRKMRPLVTRGVRQRSINHAFSALVSVSRFVQDAAVPASGLSTWCRQASDSPAEFERRASDLGAAAIALDASVTPAWLGELLATR